MVPLSFIHRPQIKHTLSVLQVFPNRSLSKLKECITIRDKLLSRKLEEHKVTPSQMKTCGPPEGSSAPCRLLYSPDPESPISSVVANRHRSAMETLGTSWTPC